MTETMNTTFATNDNNNSKKATRKDLFMWTRDFLETFIGADSTIADPDMLEQAIDMCNRYIGQLEKPVKPRANEKAIAFAAECYDLIKSHASEDEEGAGAAEIANWYNEAHPVDPDDIDAKPASVQKVAAAMRRLVAEGKVEKVEGKKKTLYRIIEDDEA